MSIKFLVGPPTVLALFLLCATPAWCISPSTVFIPAKFIPGTFQLQAGEEARIEKESEPLKQPFGISGCILQMFVEVTADFRRPGGPDDSQHALALARAEVFKRVLERSGLQGAALVQTGVSFAHDDRNMDLGMFTVQLAPSIRYSGTGGGFERIPELAECSLR
ncbi:hypothetical protein [Variovorax boronicumulans]|uniref:hypothetical protein n=1 Tax=Variovorax boronicumulans TaxID=436515 RepID=UPI00339A65C6